jgi:hypothetical protein
MAALSREQVTGLRGDRARYQDLASRQMQGSEQVDAVAVAGVILDCRGD